MFGYVCSLCVFVSWLSVGGRTWVGRVGWMDGRSVWEGRICRVCLWGRVADWSPRLGAALLSGTVGFRLLLTTGGGE